MNWLRRSRHFLRNLKKVHVRRAAIAFVSAVFVVVYLGLLNTSLVSKGDAAGTASSSIDDRFVFASDMDNPYAKGFPLSADRRRLAQHGAAARLALDSEATRMRHLMANNRRLGALDDGGPMIVAISADENDGIDCGAMAEIVGWEFLASGWTKAVYAGRYRGIPVAVKTVNTNGHDFESCLLQPNSSTNECYRKSAAKILKEIVLLKELVHHNILKIYGYCIPSADETNEINEMIAMVTELGNPVDIIKLLQMSWEDRLRISLGVARLLYHLSHSPLGSLAMNDFRRQQFVVVKGEVKLSDVDDISLDEPFCIEKNPCILQLPASNSSLQVDCIQGYCKGYNEKQNIVKAGRHFTTFLLPHGVPSSLKALVDKLITAYQTLSWNSQQILEFTEKIVHLFKSGKYLERESSNISQEYQKFDSSDLPGKFDYRCHLSLSGSGCTLSVFDIQEAQEICSADIDCRAFVITNENTWTGRKIVHFKNNYSYPVENTQTHLYIKVP